MNLNTVIGSSNKLISFEGIDGSGKSTHLRMLNEFLLKQRITTFVTREPGWESEVSGIIRHLVLEGNTSAAQKLFLILADRADHYEKMICPILRGGYGVPHNAVVLCDRGPDSTIAYQGFGEGLAPTGLLVEANRIATQGVNAGLTFLLDIDPKIALERAKDPNYFEKQGLEFYNRVREGFLAIASTDKNRVYVLDATKSIEEVHKEIVGVTMNFLSN